MSEILTFTGKMFDPLNPDVDLIDIRDIAHALAHICRANGHYAEFYSVCQHSLDCYREAVARGESKKIQLACLLHDASEAYLSDVTRPVKAAMPMYLEFETPLQNTIWEHFLGSKLTEREEKTVFQIDDAMLYHEFLAHTGMALAPQPPKIWGSHAYTFVPFAEVESAFLDAFEKLTT